MSDEKVVQLVRWNSCDARAVVEQLLERVKRAEEQGMSVGVVTCLISAHADGGRIYEPAFSTLPVESVLWATARIRREVEKTAYED